MFTPLIGLRIKPARWPARQRNAPAASHPRAIRRHKRRHCVGARLARRPGQARTATTDPARALKERRSTGKEPSAGPGEPGATGKVPCAAEMEPCVALPSPALPMEKSRFPTKKSRVRRCGVPDAGLSVPRLVWKAWWSALGGVARGTLEPNPSTPDTFSPDVTAATTRARHWQ